MSWYSLKWLWFARASRARRGGLLLVFVAAASLPIGGLPTVASIVSDAQAQWQIVAPNALPPPQAASFGAMQYKDGMLWAGTTALVFSSDSGRTGAALDVAGNAWPGRSMLSIAPALPGVVAGHAKFRVFNDSNTDAHAAFDSLTILSAITPCEYSISEEAATSTIAGPSGCGVPTLSQLIQLGKIPHFSARPNPALGSVWITSNRDVGGATIEVFDMLGMKQEEIAVAKISGLPLEVRLPSASGVYTIVIQSALGTRTLRVVQTR